MTNEEAIKYLIQPVATSTVPSNEFVKQMTAWSMAVRALNGEPKHGRWMQSKDGHGCECSECGTAYRWSEAETMRYCKICGARMDGGENA